MSGKNTRAVATVNPAIFADLPPIDGFSIKTEMLAADLCSLLYRAGKTRSELASDLGYQKSYVTKLLSGDNNTKIKTIWEVASHLGYDFDVVFHGPSDPSPKQPWQLENSKVKSEVAVAQETTFLHTPPYPISFRLQSGNQVAADVASGQSCLIYIGIERSQPITTWIPPTKTLTLDERDTDRQSNSTFVFSPGSPLPTK